MSTRSVTPVCACFEQSIVEEGDIVTNEQWLSIMEPVLTTAEYYSDSETPVSISLGHFQSSSEESNRTEMIYELCFHMDTSFPDQFVDYMAIEENRQVIVEDLSEFSVQSMSQADRIICRYKKNHENEVWAPKNAGMIVGFSVTGVAAAVVLVIWIMMGCRGCPPRRFRRQALEEERRKRSRSRRTDGDSAVTGSDQVPPELVVVTSASSEDQV